MWIAQFKILVHLACAKTNPVLFSPIVDLNSVMAPYALLVVPMLLKVRQGTALVQTPKITLLLVILMAIAVIQKTVMA
jgi:hypothetical protein